MDGRGVFTGADSRVVIRPASGGGIVFRTASGDVAARIEHLDDRPLHPALEGAPPRSTNLRSAGAGVGTVEHVVSALAGLGMWNAMVEVDGPEVPIVDGSSRAFAEAVRDARLEPTSPSRTDPIVVRERVAVSDGSGEIVAEPLPDDIGAACEMSYHLDYADAGRAALPPQHASWDGLGASYLADIAPARTFSLLGEVEAMRGLGLFEGFSPRELLVLGPDGPIENEWRFVNEPARHKLLDLIGDLALAGGPIRGRITARRSGHALNHELARVLAERR